MTQRYNASPKLDVYQQITDQIVAAIEAGAGDVEMPWHRSGVATTCPANAFTAQRYQGINILSLWAAAASRAFTSGTWATFKQWQCLGAQVRKGEKGSPIVFYKRDGPAENEDDNQTRARWFARTSWVFNAEQVDDWTPPRPIIRSPAEVLAEAEAFVSRTGANIRHGTDGACYRPLEDVIEMPDRAVFTGTATSGATESYYAILFHELTHWSGHLSRLDRQMKDRFGEAAYAMEELVAELGASFLCAENTIVSQPRPDHAGYIASWLKALKNDKRAIFTAARMASEATIYLLALPAPDTGQQTGQHVVEAQS